MSNLKALQTLMTSFKTDWTTSKRKWKQDTILKVAKTGRSLSFKCYASFICATLVYIVFTLLKFYKNMQQTQRKLIYQFPYPYDVQKTPLYVITFFMQMTAAVYVATINTTIDTFVSLLLLQICAQLINLRIAFNEWVENLTENTMPVTEFKKGLAAIILQHEHLIRYVGEILECDLIL